MNDPASLANAVNKTYFQHFPEAVRPRTLISRDPDEIAAFVKEIGRRRRAQAAAGLRRRRRLLRLRRRVAEPQPDDRGGRPRRLHRRPGDPPRGRPGRRAAVPHERRAARRRTATTPRSGASTRRADPRSNMRVGGEAEPVKVDDAMLAGRRGRAPQAASPTACSSSVSTSSATSSWRSTSSAPAGWAAARRCTSVEVHRRGDRRARAQGRPARPLPRHAHEREPRHALTSASAEFSPSVELAGAMSGRRRIRGTRSRRPPCSRAPAPARPWQ